MRFTLIALLPLIGNILLIQGHNNEHKQKADSEISEKSSYNSILKDMNIFYSQEEKQPTIVSNPNVKAQLTNNDNKADGIADGTTDGKADGTTDGKADGTTDGKADGTTDGKADGTTDGKADGTTDGTTDGKADGITDGKADGTTDGKNDGKADDNANKKDGDDKKNKKEEVEEKVTPCGVGDVVVGKFIFYRPIGNKSVMVSNSNYTIMWYYHDIKPDYDEGFYLYPKDNITIKLFREEDANPNSWATAFQKPIFIRTIPMSQVELGPVIKNIQHYQYNWIIDPNKDKDEYVGNLLTNQKYKLRIYGDGKDTQSNKDNYQCYNDGDIIPALTYHSFYIVENTYIKPSAPIPIEDGARISSNISLIMTFMISMFVILYHNW